MKSDAVIQYGSKSDYVNKTGASLKNSASSAMDTKTINSSSAKEFVDKIKSEVRDAATKVEVSDEAKNLAKSKGLIPPAKDLAKEVLAEPPLPSVLASKNSKAIALSKMTKSKFNTHRNIEKPAIFFIRGFELIGSGGGGMKEMSDHVTDAKYFSWQDQDKMVDEIMKRPAHQPVILVGHGLGGDTAVEISNKLNKASHSFKKVDLLVTLDSVGFDNDIIPQNVVKNLNYITDGATFLNDAPNIARRTEETKVENYLSTEDHNDLVGSSDVQFKIFDSINDVLLDMSSFKSIPKEIVSKEV